MKKFINKVDDIVEEMIEGLVLAHPENLTRVPDQTVIIRKNLNKNKVSLISGGGSGHEPAHAGYVGEGMLDAAVCGPIFTSPAPDQVLAAIEATKSDKGALLIIKNYTGDVMNFEMAKDMAAMQDMNVESVVVDDDIALENSTYTVGQRGIAGTVFVHKCAGAKAETGASLAEVKATAEKVIQNMASYGIALDACVVPANAKKSFTLNDDECEIGLGIHGEPGVERAPMKSADEFIDLLYGHVKQHLKLKNGDEIALMINGLGATPAMELAILARKAIKNLQKDGVLIAKSFVGNYMTSIDMPGFSLSILRLDSELKTLINSRAVTDGMVVL